MERPSSSYLDHFLKDTAGSPTSNNNIYNNLPVRAPKMGISVKLNSQFDLEQPPPQRQLPTSPSSLSQHQQPIYSNQPSISSPRSNYASDDGFSTRRSNASDTSMEYSSNRKMHQFVVRTFSTPTKCHHCTSLMVCL